MYRGLLGEAGVMGGGLWCPLTVEEILKAEKYRNERCGSHRRQAMSSVAGMAHTDDEAEE